ncbi:GDP-L-fucose synthase [Pseudomonas asiatica]|uniref:GDP-L-fucose synthase family protein n=1 Tax=Pseudomonas TaxID=286 RepID=UPI001BAF4F7A|nr:MULTISPECIES: GDP-L-fucose synthase [Pseudomonas]QUN69218.1 GDP-L-fucose synthase [Pseudomonas sp. JS425]WJM54982.1 GDP-L-fucose synthase [Pseudomonas asiatica]
MYSDKILITGASGVIGQALLQELAKAGYSNVVAPSSKDADLRDEAQANALLEEVRPAVVYHLAARVYGIMGNMQNKAQAFLENTRINTNLIEASQRVGVKKIVAMGSSAIYSDSVTLPMSEDQVWCGPPHHSEAPYAHSKRAMLAQLEAYRDQYGMEFAFCISTNLYGPHDKFDEKWGHVIPSLISKFHKAIQQGESVPVWGTGSARRDFLFNEDAARAMRLIGEQAVGAINLATGTSQTIRETVECIKKVSGFTGDIVWDSSKPDGQHLRDYDISKLQEVGFKPEYSLEAGLAKTYHWFKENPGQVRR